MSKDPGQITLPFGAEAGEGDAPREAPKPKPRRRAKPRPQPAPKPEPAPKPAPAPPVAADPPEPEVLTVARLDRLIKRLVENATAQVMVRGEISGLRRAGSGHAYFSLKDEREDAIIDCVMYRTAPAKARQQLAEGERVVLSGRVTLYAPRGRLQFIADDLLETARGALLEQLERLKKKLAAEGLFDEARKKPLPADPKVVAVLTSRAGAAIHDVIRVAFGRGRLRLLLVNTPVQGAGAAYRIARAVAGVDRLGLDAMIVTRGGGSAEDLAAYNDEQVVRAIAAARTPVVSAVGHEIDVSLSDLAADARAATPSQAAEILVPDGRARVQRLGHLQRRLERSMGQRLTVRRATLAELRHRLGEPHRRLQEQSQRFDDLTLRLERAMARRLRTEGERLRKGRRTLETHHPAKILAETRLAIAAIEPRLQAALTRRLTAERRRLERLEPRLATQVTERLRDERARLTALAGRLEALSPLQVLSRGYAIALDADGRALRRAEDAPAGSRLELRLHEGNLNVTVDDADG